MNDDIFFMFSPDFLRDVDNNTDSDITKHPLYIMRMFRKVLRNYEELRKQYDDLVDKLFKDIEMDESKKQIVDSYLKYNRAYNHLKNLNPDDPYTIQSLKKLDDPTEYIGLLKESISHFESIEEYEKCAHIKGVLDLMTKI